ncbi:TPM domain-containing protein [Tellurirhabdus bombi]|uniref:TPM domain-containing protein n=1 Tax=Tellurirhabdus bombi TaxID=2907205 RepID=UPI001F21AFF2|nr:TPM domain-containing protein [Tellurirhabdus bombi]
MSAINLFSPEQQKQIVAAIQEAEGHTSGEVRVHLEAKCAESNVLDRAVQVFYQLEMDKTAQQNGVLFYLATEDHKFAILGDKGINQVVPKDFWESTKELMRTHFRRGQFTEGLCQGIEQAGQQLKQYFPRANDDKNELSDELSF